MRTSRKCGKCGSREDIRKGRSVQGYGSVCASCFALCQIPVAGLARAIEALAFGAVRLPLGFTSYRAIRAIREAQESARVEREAVERAAQERAARERVQRLQERAARSSLSRSKRRELRGRLKAQGGVKV